MSRPGHSELGYHPLPTGTKKEAGLAKPTKKKTKLAPEEQAPPPKKPQKKAPGTNENKRQLAPDIYGPANEWKTITGPSKEGSKKTTSVQIRGRPSRPEIKDVNPQKISVDEINNRVKEYYLNEFGTDNEDKVAEMSAREADPNLSSVKRIRSRSANTTDKLLDQQIEDDQSGVEHSNKIKGSPPRTASMRKLDILATKKGKLYNLGQRKTTRANEQYAGAPNVDALANKGVVNSRSAGEAFVAAKRAKQRVGNKFMTTMAGLRHYNPKTETWDHPLLQEAQRRMFKESASGGARKEWSKDREFETGADFIDWIAVVGNRYQRYGELWVAKQQNKLSPEDKKEWDELENYMAKQRGLKGKKKLTDLDLTAQLIKLYDTASYREFGKALAEELGTPEKASLIEKSLVEMRINEELNELVKSMDEEKENVLQEFKKSMDEIAKAFDELTKSIDVLAKDRDDIVDVLEYFDQRLDGIEKSAKDMQVWMTSEKKTKDKDEKEEDDEEVKKMAEGVPTKTLATGENNAPVMKGKENDIEQKEKVTEEIPIPGDVKKQPPLPKGDSSFNPKSMIDEGPKLNKGFEEGKKVGEMNAIKKLAEDAVETPSPASVVEQGRSLEPLSKSDTDLVSMSFAQIERMMRRGQKVL